MMNFNQSKMKNILLYIWLCLGCITSTYAQTEKEIVSVKSVWSSETQKSQNLKEGLAGSFFGKQNKWFILAGGSAFSNGKPWENGKKYFSDDIFVFEKKGKDLDFIFQDKKLPQGIADGAYVSLPNGLLCVGGQTENGFSKEVFLISYLKNAITITSYPELPEPVRSASATSIGSKVYLVGGQLADGKSSNQFLMLDIAHLDKGWQKLPDYPLEVSGSAIASQQDGEEVAVFVFGGRNKSGEITDFYDEVYSYKPSRNQWFAKKSIQLNKENLNLAVAVAGNVGASSIVLIGGDTGKIYNQIEKAINASDIDLRNQLWQNHSGFNSNVLVYNSVTDEWFSEAKITNPTAVSSVFSTGKDIYVTGGERSPGVRSPYIFEFSFNRASHFGWINYTILIAYFIGMLFVGFFFMKNNNNTDDYFKAGGRIPWWAAGISIFATTLSAITFISIPAKSYATDWRMLMFNMSIILAVPFIIRYFLPFFLRFNFNTAYEYLEARFSRPIRWIASALFLFFMISRIAIVLFLPSLALNAVTGFSVYYSIIIMSIVTIIYSTSGGMEAVVWGDVIQGFILIVGALLAFVFMVTGIEGGLSEFWTTTVEFHKMKTFDFNFDFSQPVFWVVILGGLANTIISYTSDQSVVQRYMTTKDEKATSKSIWLNGIISVPVSILFFLLGTGLFAFYKANPQDMVITNPNIDSIFPQFIVSEMPVGFAGLLIAAIFAAAMSTLSSNINSASAVVTSDFFRTIFKSSSLKKDIKVAQFSGIIIGLLGMGMALVLATWNIASLWDQFNTFLGLLTSGLGALFILGIFFPRVNSLSAFIGVVIGVFILYYVKNNTSLSFLLYGLIGMISSIVVAILCSVFYPNKKDLKTFTWKSHRN